MKNKIIIGGIVVVVIIAIVLLVKGGESDKWNGIEGESIDVAISFYANWLDAKEAGTVEALLTEAPIAETLKDTLVVGMSADVDPVACRAFEERQIRTIPVFEREDAAQYIMQPTRGEFTEGYAVVDLSGRGGAWQIENIACAYGDIAPERGEFNFDQVGGLLKNVPAPYNSDFWHLVFEDRGQIGVVPLRLSDTTECVTVDGETVSCDENFLTEAMDARVLGNLSEEGADVARIEAQ